MNSIRYILLTFLLSLIINSCVKFEDDTFTDADKTSNYKVITDTITDIDGNKYISVLIGDKWVMVDFLKVTHFNNGDPILTIPPNRNIKLCNEKNTAYQWPVNYNVSDTTNRLYTLYAAYDERGIAPEGYRVISYYEVYEIKSYIRKWNIKININWDLTNDPFKCNEIMGIIYTDNPNKLLEYDPFDQECDYCTFLVKCVKDTNFINNDFQLNNNHAGLKSIGSGSIQQKKTHILNTKTFETKFNSCGNINNNIPGLELCHSVVTSILPYNNELWIGTYDGLTRYIPSSSTSSCIADYKRDGTGPINYWGARIICGLEIKEGLLEFWDNDNIYYYSRDSKSMWSTYNTISGLGVYSAMKDDLLWYGTNKGVYCIENNEMSQFGLEDKHIYSLQLYNNKKWFGTNKGLYSYSEASGGTWAEYTNDDELISNDIYCMTISKDNKLWIGTPIGLSTFNGVYWSSIYNFNSMGCTFVNVITVDQDGVIWVGTYGGGISAFDGLTWETYTKENGLKSNYVTAIAVDEQNKKWIGTLKGISKIE